MDEKTERNQRVQARYDELMREGKHGHYETMFQIVREEVERATDPLSEKDPQISDPASAIQAICDDLKEISDVMKKRSAKWSDA